MPSRPVIRLKPKTRPEGAPGCPECEGWMMYQISRDQTECVKCGYVAPTNDPEQLQELREDRFKYPKFWTKGQLLNCRRNGDTFILTVLEEEFDREHPERSVIYDNSRDCNDFLSWFYNREPGPHG